MTVAGLRADALACHAAALAAVDPARLVRARLIRDDDRLGLLAPDGAVLATHRGPVVVVGGGKAGLAMARAAATIAGPSCRGGVVVVPESGGDSCAGGVRIARGSHPVPDAAGERATADVLAIAGRADGRTLVVVLLSGGASALLVAPAAGVALEDKAAMTRALLASGADIGVLNVVRKHCSRVKGGGLARAASGAAGTWTLALSDVVGDDLATIASGPTVADPSTFADAQALLGRWLVPADVPSRVRDRLARGAAGDVPETVKPGDAVLARTVAVVIGGNRDAVAAAVAAATSRGYATDVVPEPLAGDAAAVGRAIAARLRRLPPGRAAVIAGGETTVRVVRGGRGGRAQHLALAAAIALAGAPAVVLAVGTDGRDGPTDVAGACIDGDTVRRAGAAGLDAGAALAATDSHPLLAATGDLVRTGWTGTNVADLVVALRAAC
jgi:glycerate 2-kinase